MRHALLAIMTIALAMALRCIFGLVYRVNDVGNRNVLHASRELITAAGSMCAFHQFALMQLTKQALQV